MVRLFVTLLALLCCSSANTQDASIKNPVLSGVARVVDGDTLQVAGVNVRLEGIDAPERDQTCEHEGRAWACGLLADGMLRALIRGRPVTCQVTGKDVYRRALAVCHAGEDNLNSLIVRSGFAMAFRRYSDRYLPDEAAAKADHAGMWIGTFVAPWDWRRGERAEVKENGNALPQSFAAIEQAATTSASSEGLEQPAPGCAIKGNVNRLGERIYHVPGMWDYAKVVMDPTKGKRWFCSEEDAARGGWRRAAR